jgi:acetolactate synthase small subunit
MALQKATRYNIVVKNKPGELAKLTKLLTDVGVNVSSLIVANIGDMASIQFSTAEEDDIPEHLWKSALKPRSI